MTLFTKLTAKTLIITPDRNSRGRSDYSGAFDIEADALELLMGKENIDRLEFNLTGPIDERSAQVISGLYDLAVQKKTYEAVALFMHGTSSGIQAGFHKKNVWQFADALLPLCADPKKLTVTLYCCSVAGERMVGSNNMCPSFAGVLRDALAVRGVTDVNVYGHATRGHTTYNPYVKVWQGLGVTQPGTDGLWVVRPPNEVASPFWRTWVKALKAHEPADLFICGHEAKYLRLLFPYISFPQLYLSLEALKAMR